ncbi:hypothetical protein AWB91_09040 [Mycobacterium paraense]|uniref:Uncharacterized protein n=2 Tax=Mycobacterium paraense TaxID=767916 RepID=A0ABX3VTC3_9MYCO|nr:hypothetical protein AWB91_09040 [Mycobacterium paraense]ORW34678.1 hypothetical protein AWB88_02735 [Mycobacterium paraense]
MNEKHPENDFCINTWKDDNFELGGFPTVEMTDGIRVHFFRDTGRAYNECQCNESIRTGDVLVIQQEQTVGLADAWPVAVSKEAGHLHQLLEGHTFDDVARHAAEVVRGLWIARLICEANGW